MKNSVSKLEEELGKQKDINTSIQLELDNLKQEFSDLEVQLAKSEEIIYNYKTLIENLRNSKEKILSELEFSESKIHEIQSQLDSEKDKTLRIQKEWSAYKSQMEEERAKLAESKEIAISELSKTKNKLYKEKQLQDNANATLLSLNEKVKNIEEKYGQELTQYKKSYEDLEKELTETKNSFRQAMKTSSAIKQDILRGVERIETEARACKNIIDPNELQKVFLTAQSKKIEFRKCSF